MGHLTVAFFIVEIHRRLDLKDYVSYFLLSSLCLDYPVYMTCSPSHLVRVEKGFRIICSKSDSVSAIWRICLSIIHQCVKHCAREQLSIEGQPIGLIQVKSDVWLPEQTYHSQAARWLWPRDTTTTLDLDFSTLWGFHLSVSILVYPAFPVLMGDLPGLTPYFSKIIKKLEEAAVQSFLVLWLLSILHRQWQKATNWLGSNHDFKEKQRWSGTGWSGGNDLCPYLLCSGHMGLRRC